MGEGLGWPSNHRRRGTKEETHTARERDTVSPHIADGPKSCLSFHKTTRHATLNRSRPSHAAATVRRPPSPRNDPFFMIQYAMVHDRLLHSPILASNPRTHAMHLTSITTRPLATQAPSHPIIPCTTPRMTLCMSRVCPMHTAQTFVSQAPCSPYTGPHGRASHASSPHADGPQWPHPWHCLALTLASLPWPSVHSALRWGPGAICPEFRHSPKPTGRSRRPMTAVDD